MLCVFPSSSLRLLSCRKGKARRSEFAPMSLSVFSLTCSLPIALHCISTWGECRGEQPCWLRLFSLSWSASSPSRCCPPSCRVGACPGLPGLGIWPEGFSAFQPHQGLRSRFRCRASNRRNTCPCNKHNRSRGGVQGHRLRGKSIGGRVKIQVTSYCRMALTPEKKGPQNNSIKLQKME